MGETHNTASEASQVRVLNCYCSSTVIDPIDSIVCIVCVGLCIHASPQRRYRGLLHEKKNQEKGEKETRYPHFCLPNMARHQFDPLCFGRISVNESNRC